MGQFTTHVLDTARGRPAAGVPVTLHHLSSDGRRLVASTTTNADGRTGAPLVSGSAMLAGQYELTFSLGDYWRVHGVTVTVPPFLDEVVIRVGVADVAGHYHVPLLVSPYGYSTYRGS